MRPNAFLAGLNARHLRIIDRDGTIHETFMNVVLGEYMPHQFCIRVVNGGSRYLTDEAVKMIRATGETTGPAYLLSLVASE